MIATPDIVAPNDTGKRGRCQHVPAVFYCCKAQSTGVILSTVCIAAGAMPIR